MTTIDQIEIPLLQFDEAAAPSTPASGLVRIYAKADGLIYSKDDAGTELLMSTGPIGGGGSPLTTKGDIWGFSTVDARVPIGANNLALIADSAQSLGLKWAHPVLTSATAQLAADVTITTGGTFYDGPSVSLAAGTWLLLCSVLIQDNGASPYASAKLWDGTTVTASGELSLPASGNVGQLPLVAIVTPGSTTTYKVSATARNNGSAIVAAVFDPSSQGNNASKIVAVRVA